MNKIQLLPCPFCGSRAAVATHPMVDGQYFSVICINSEDGCWASDAPATALGSTPEMAAEVWNMRDESRLRDALEHIGDLPYWEGVKMIKIARKALKR